MNDLFQFPAAAAATPATRSKSLPAANICSHVVTKTSTFGRDVEYARLSEDDHAYTRAVIEALNHFRKELRQVLDMPSGLYGRRSQSKQTKGELLDGFIEKLSKPHPAIRGRKGEDFTIKQLKALNKIIDDVNALLSGESIEHVNVP
ncbi:hypothetical protein [Methylobacterium sp. 37f]|uniref:hypothetical protein n=1 Tax=Methylobacterium sp. 37f TaxID=2817058 RepID=UPI001FFC93E0|nr:hypothetical protein [Methylobacterium sp. 37f]MCK2054771.1 hypothetical protein [Methylobacterium sp. 37f]